MPKAKNVLKTATLKKFDAFSLKSVDIIIPFHAAYGKVTRAVESILLYTNHPYKITLIDDASPNEEYGERLLELNDVADNLEVVGNKLKKVDLIKVLRNPKQLGFGASLNAGIKNTECPWVVFMHSDCVCEVQGWLELLGHSLKSMRQKNVKMVSVKSDNPGDYPEMLKRPKVVPREFDTSDLLLNGDVIRDSAYLPLLGAMCHRGLFEAVGYFKEYPYAWYEDLEFAFRMRSHGYFQGVSGTSWLRHEGGGTINTLFQKQGLQDIMDENRKQCISDIKAIKNEKKKAVG
tara:strand:+ start:848 stop:1717 length:870 start_codon:yes stop_codon:yes gene_type:complete